MRHVEVSKSIMMLTYKNVYISEMEFSFKPMFTKVILLSIMCTIYQILNGFNNLYTRTHAHTHTQSL